MNNAESFILSRLLAMSLIVVVLTSCKSRPIESLSHQPVKKPVTSNPQSWVSFGASDNFVVRTTMAGAQCPELRKDGVDLKMELRSQVSAEFPTGVCELSLPRQTARASIGDFEVPLLHGDPKKIVMIGDTGCQVSKKRAGERSQGCNLQDEWPFMRIAEAAARWKPDLVIHVGDYHYREAPCLPGTEKCRGVTAGDNEQSWREDFFEPARSLLNFAPWIFVRGNHELCNRGGRGWFMYLDPRSYQLDCVNETEPYVVNFASESLAVIDAATDHNIQPSLGALRLNSEGRSWVLLHRPFLTFGGDDEQMAKAVKIPDRLQKIIAVVFAGHQHRFSIQDFSDLRPPEIITGNGGTLLEAAPETMKKNETIYETQSFGFLTLERLNQHSWKLTERSAEGIPVKTCVFDESRKAQAGHLALVCN